MRFEIEGRKFALGFERRKKHIEVMQGGKARTILSTYPYTTVTLYEVVKSAMADGTKFTREVVLAYATVGCMPGDHYSNEQGRLQALKALTKTLTRKLGKSKEFRRALWDAYRSRGKKQLEVIDAVVTKVEDVTPALEDVTPPTQPLALPPAQMSTLGDVVH